MAGQRLLVCVFLLVVALLMMTTTRTYAAPSTQPPSMSSSSEEDDDRCDIRCPYNFDPVCGSDGDDTFMFANECFMDRHNCKHQRQYTRVDGNRCMLSEFVDT